MFSGALTILPDIRLFFARENKMAGHHRLELGDVEGLLNWTVNGLMTDMISNGLIKLGDSFFDSVYKWIFRVHNQTF